MGMTLSIVNNENFSLSFLTERNHFKASVRDDWCFCVSKREEVLLLYPVSEAFLQAVQENTRKFYWTGRITTKAGAVYEFGNVMHYGLIEKFIESLGEQFNIREIAFDRWGAVHWNRGLPTVGIRFCGG